MVAKYMEKAEEMKQRHNDLQRHSRAVLAAKLAARRRQKEEMNKEAAMKKELKEMSKKQVTKLNLSGSKFSVYISDTSLIRAVNSVRKRPKFT